MAVLKKCSDCKYSEKTARLRSVDFAGVMRVEPIRCFHPNALVDPMVQVEVTVPDDFIYADIHRRCDCGIDAKYFESQSQGPILDVTRDKKGFVNFFWKKTA